MSRRLKLRFFLDEGVTVSAGKALEAAGHEVIYFDQSGVAKSTEDPIVCLTAEANKAILVANDADMQTLARGHGLTPARFRALSLLRLHCREAASPQRITEAMSLIEHEWRKGRGRQRRLFVVIGDSPLSDGARLRGPAVRLGGLNSHRQLMRAILG